ncbi:MAG: C25 family cysteine peptidase [candidate division KSB1 bacterium]|nr:C25 family cysteine peptidase [candidate division KSB1 bacterium]
MWADNSLMRLEDVERLSNKGRYPIITSMTCFTGAFDNSWRKTLAEEFLLQPDRGAHAIWASSGLGWTYEDFNIVRELFDLMNKYGNALTLGEYLAAAKINYIAKHLNALGFSILNQYNLLGDPATRLLLPAPKITLNAPGPFVRKGDNLSISGTTEFQQGEGMAQLVNKDRVVEASVPITVQNGRFTTSLSVPDSIHGQKLWLRVYAKSSDGQNHASTAREMNLNFILVDSIYTNVPTASAGVDSIFFFAHVVHANPLSKKRILTQLPTNATLPLVYDADQGVYRTQRGYPPLRNGEVVRFRLELEDEQGHQYTSAWLDERLRFGPDLKVQAKYVELEAANSLAVSAYVFNIGDADVDRAVVRFELFDDYTQSWRLLADDTVAVAQKDRAMARAALSPKTGQWRIRITADPENRIAESDEQNNQAVKTFIGNLFPVTVQNGTTLNDTRTDTIHYDPFLRFFVPAGAVSENRFLRIDRLDSLRINHQPDFQPLQANGKPIAYAVSLQDTAQTDPLAGVHLLFPVDSVQQMVFPGNQPQGASEAQLCRFDSLSGKWIRVDAERSGESMIARVSAPGLYGLFVIHDQTPPKLELTVQGQLLSLGGYVPAEPVFHLIATDMNGIDRSAASVRVWIDDAPLSYSSFTFADSAASMNGTAFIFRPPLTPGEHVLRAQIKDAAGNESEPFEALFKVAEAQKLIFLGNYPNPFENATTFAFELSDHARDLELKIYTTSGHLIRTITVDEIVEDPNPLGPNYHEITWDARDAFGERVANGLYYFKLKVVFQNGVAEHVGRIARLK